MPERLFMFNYVVGGLRKDLVFQFLTESVLYVLISSIFGLLLLIISRKYFSDILNEKIPDFFDLPSYFIPTLLLFAFLVGILAGAYPAFVLSALKSVDSLKARAGTIKEKISFTKTLVGFQFAVAAMVMIGAIVISQQVSLFFSSKLGYDKDYIIHAQLPRDWSPQGVAKMESFRSRIALLPEVKDASISFEIPDGINGGNYSIYRQGSSRSQSIMVEGLIADFEFANTYSIPIRSGTFFSNRYNPADSDKIVINEAASKALGWETPSEAIGKKYTYTARIQ